MTDLCRGREGDLRVESVGSSREAGEKGRFATPALSFGGRACCCRWHDVLSRTGHEVGNPASARGGDCVVHHTGDGWAAFQCTTTCGSLPDAKARGSMWGAQLNAGRSLRDAGDDPRTGRCDLHVPHAQGRELSPR